METRYYDSTAILDLGVANVVISAWDTSSKISIETIIVFIDKSNRSYTEVRHVEHVKANNLASEGKYVEDLFREELDYSKGIICYQILYKYFPTIREKLSAGIDIVLMYRKNKIQAGLIFMKCIDAFVKNVDLLKDSSFKDRLKPYYIFKRSAEQKLKDKGDLLYLKYLENNKKSH